MMGARKSGPISAALLADMEHGVLGQYERAPVGFLCLSVDGWIGKANATLLSWLGYAQGELVGRMRFHDLIGAGARMFFDTQHASLLLLRGQVQDIAIDLRARDGTQVPVLVNTVLERDPQGKPLFMQMSLFNASERRRYERELLQAKRQAEQASAMLEEQVSERTAQLASALVRAESAMCAKNDFLANMSHEIRTPLNCILGMTHLLRDSVPDQPAGRYLDTIVQAGNSVVRLVSEILDFCKIDAGKLELEHLPFDLRRVVAEVTGRFAGLASERGLALGVDVDAGLPPQLVGDASRLSQILSNYLGNAIKFTSQGRIRVRALLAGGDRDRVRVRLEVEDTGIGLSPDQQASLFQPFHQADSSTTRHYGGTGLGLAISRQLAELMGGCVGVSSSGAGSLFWVEVDLAPVAHSRAGDTAARLPHEAGDRAGRAPADLACLQGAHILLAEDNPLNQELMRILIERTGARVTIAADGDKALAAMESTSFDCVLMDVQMPGMGGCEATRRIRADARLRRQVVIALTANASDSSRAQCRDAGMNDFLVKPVDVPLFYATLEKWIGGRTGAAPAADVPPATEGQSDAMDPSLLASLVGDDPEAIAGLMALFFDNADATVGELSAALSAGALDEAWALAHRLKSSARAVGAVALGEACLAVEGAQSLAEAASAHATLVACLARLRARLGQPAVHQEQARGCAGQKVAR